MTVGQQLSEVEITKWNVDYAEWCALPDNIKCIRYEFMLLRQAHRHLIDCAKDIVGRAEVVQKKIDRLAIGVSELIEPGTTKQDNGY